MYNVMYIHVCEDKIVHYIIITFNYLEYHYINLTVVRVCVRDGRSSEATLPRRKKSPFFATLHLDATEVAH